ncbi:MAG: glycoside hydrolase family 3 N-terminal domain-containing protein [Candidatus Brevundimonas colombiensis]|uniref:beta-glucosidase n=1 Tax=Candidatus Brevundimonas colombiensis TaxID=3121376 RepID=A0AAJ5X3S8_9CAUL|nr:glycoside hydrolase family 3 N-terminal domain-containing protein [Brevundimonas sp.]WEK41459.1 MAG: glycoside hydrolase family 3 N-terminal domain-containing protein [Brevundimonas sp.]
MPGAGRADTPVDAAASLAVDGQSFRDLNHNGKLDPYEDHRLPMDARIADILGRMTLAEKAGLLVHGTAPALPDPAGGGLPGAGQAAYDLKAFEGLVERTHISSVITRLSVEPRRFAEQNNALQSVASRSRLGVPVTISTDPRNHFQHVDGASVAAGGFSQWPETLGLAAIGDAALVRRFGDAIRAEYRAVGIHMALSPQVDLATEPRWSRINGAFGEDAQLARRMTQAYVIGFQGGPQGLRPDGVATVVKHWVGYGASPQGWDGHNYYGRFSRLSDSDLAQHVIPFLGAFDAGVAGVMPTYNILQGPTLNGHPLEAVGAGFSRELLTDLLRGRYGFKGLVLSDWAITNDCNDNCRTGARPHGFGDIAMPWGVEDLSETERFAKGVNAGVDQFGGTDRSDRIVAAVQAGDIPVARMDEAARRVLRLKYELGLFDNPFVDPDQAAATVGRPDIQAEADAAQRRGMVVLENRLPKPLAAGARIHLTGIEAEAARRAGLVVVDDLSQADFALVRTVAPYERPHPNFFFGSRQNEGSLAFLPDHPALTQVRRAAAADVPVIVGVYLDRPAILTPLQPLADLLLGEFGASDAAFLAVAMTPSLAEGRLPFALPRSMAEVEAQSPGTPNDLQDPLYPIGYHKAD